MPYSLGLNNYDLTPATTLNQAVYDGHGGIWTADGNTADLFKIHTADGSIAFNTGIIATNGNFCYDAFSNTVWTNDQSTGPFAGYSKVALDGTVLGTFELDDTGPMCSDGLGSIWIFGGNAVTNLYRISATTGAILGSFTFPLNFVGEPIFAAGLLWTLAQVPSNTLYAFDLTGTLIFTIPLTGSAQTPSQIAFDGANIWTVDALNQSAQIFKAADGSLVATIALPNQHPFNYFAVAFDGVRMWIPSETGNSVVIYDAATMVFLAELPALAGNVYLAWDGVRMWLFNESNLLSSGLLANPQTISHIVPVGVIHSIPVCVEECPQCDVSIPILRGN